jgi:hypothetical protein
MRSKQSVYNFLSILIVLAAVLVACMAFGVINLNTIIYKF